MGYYVNQIYVYTTYILWIYLEIKIYNTSIVCIKCDTPQTSSYHIFLIRIDFIS